MSLNSKVIMGFLAGTFSAMLAWVVIDFNGFYSLSGSPDTDNFFQLFSQQAFLGAVFGIFVGLAIGLVNGLSAGTSRLVWRCMLWGAAVGLGGGLLGLFFGQCFFSKLYKDPREIAPLAALGPLYFIWDVIVRAIGWAFIGVFLGLVQGLPSRSWKAARHGAVGGFIGGLLGGTLFEIVPYILPPGTSEEQASIVCRGIGMTVTGASIGFFIGLVENLLKQAWIRVVQGRNEGREYVISKARTTIGRDELSDVGLFGDRDISPLHAVIELQNGRHILRDAGSSLGTAVSGQKVTEHTLRDGEIIEIGSMRLEFHEKATASKLAVPAESLSKPPVQIPVAEGVCAFCGGRKDPNTGACACTIAGRPDAAPSTRPGTAAGGEPGAAPAGTIPRLVGLRGPYAGQAFSLSPSGTTNIGREPGRDVELSLDSTVSRKHARIVDEGGSFVLYDEDSTNGTAVNGARVTRQVLVLGDLVQFGGSAFRFEN